VALAKKLGVRETEIRRMLDPDHGTKLDRLDRAMRALGRRLVVTDRPADAA
jgi:antitoxin HicB